MLYIRPEQMETLNAHSLKMYKDKLRTHLMQYKPYLCEAAGTESLKTMVDLGFQRARSCDFTLSGTIRTYLEIMLVLGSDFKRDPQYFWLMPWLRSQEDCPEMDRARLLRFHVVRYLDDVQGINGVYEIQALSQAQSITNEQLIQISGNYPQNAMKWLESMYPQKCRFIGTDALWSLIHHARKEAIQSELSSPAGAPLVLVLMFTFGSGILRDPMYPWITKTLASTYEKDKESQEKKLLRETNDYLKKLLQHLKGE
jgi:hypothetical protein